MSLRTISDIRRHFLLDQRPIYFISATSFNLLGIDEWVPRFQAINYIDCFGGRHPNIFVPDERPHDVFESIEDINNYLLVHPDVVARVTHDKGRAVFLMFDDKTEGLCKEHGLEMMMPNAKLRAEIDDKISCTRIADRAGVESVPNVLGKVGSYADLRKLAGDRLGDKLVVQTSFGDSGHTTFFISNEADYAKHAAEIEAEAEVKIMRRIRCRGSAMEACVTRHGTLVGPLMTELVGFPELTPYKGGWCGNELYPHAFPEETQRAAREAAFKFGEEIRRMGYRGYFELDFLIDQDTNKVYLGEINPRITGASAMTNLSALAHADAPLFLFHLLEWGDTPFELDVDGLNKRWADEANLDTWGQLVIKHTVTSIDRVQRAPESGIWRLDDRGVSFVRPDIHRRGARGPGEGFYLRITGPGDYRYEGADLGILMVPEKVMVDGELTERARAWIAGLRAEYIGVPLAAAAAAPPIEPGQFKIF
jgi:D-alanine-D-alanine ligase-like ATP-grasp enzyme